MDIVEIFSDGACSGNPGNGGWCTILRSSGHEKVISGAQENTTNNRMELTAVIQGLKALKRPCTVTVVSDSKYVCDAINAHWLENWKKKNWMRGADKPVLNPDLWKELDGLLKIHDVTFKWIKGHNGHPENERCDEIAVSEYRKLQR